jgi:glycosyltransferase involved in cell wall biosynthesis
MVTRLPEAEIIFFDRSEILHIDWQTRLKYRMRFLHSADFLTGVARRRTNQAALALTEIWRDRRPSVEFPENMRTIVPLLQGAMGELMGRCERVLYDIEGAYTCFEQTRPQVVVLRASVSGQPHFAVLALVARHLGIPAVELQHGLEYLGPGSWSREHTAEYVAVYGPLIAAQYRALGYIPAQLREIGSPRFDKYRTDTISDAREVAKRYTLVCVAPDVRPFELYDAYGAEAYFKVVAAAAKVVPGEVCVMIKLRPGRVHRTLLNGMIERLFGDVPHRVVLDEPLADILKQADVAISGFSTAVLEALQLGVPVVMPTTSDLETSVIREHFTMYEQCGAIRITETQEALTQALTELGEPSVRDTMKKNAKTFLVQQFCFDGKSSERLAALVAELALKNHD